MQGGIAKEDNDKLRRTIPKTTSGNPLTVHHKPPSSPELDMGTLELEKESSPSRKASKLISSRNDALKPYNCILPDEDSLTQSFENNHNSSKISSSLQNGPPANHLNKFLHEYDLADMNFSPPSRTLRSIASPTFDLEAQSSFIRRNGFVDHNSKLFKPDGCEPKLLSESVFGNIFEHQQVSPINAMAMPVNHGMVWHGMRDKRHACFNQQHIYPQHLLNYSPELFQLEKSMNLCMGPLNYGQYQPQGLSGRIENSSTDFDGRQILNEVGRKSSPEKILTRSHGTNTVRIFRHNPFTTDQSLHLDEGNVRCSNGFLQLDDQNCRYSPAVGFPMLDLQSEQIKYNSVDDVIGRVYLMSKSQQGCRFLQKKFAKSSREDISKIFMEIICHIVELMIHPFRNYLVQRLLELCNEEQITLILKAITQTSGELFRISCDMHGTRSVQKLIETLKTPDHASMVLSSLEPDIVSLMKNINGNHVAQRCFQYLSKHNKYLMEAVISHCVELAKDRQGCCVLQTCLRHSDGEQRQRLMNVISSYSVLLSKDPYGNYAIQFVLDLNYPWTTATVLNQLKGNYEHLSMQKYSSNVVEKCLKLAGENNFVQIIEELMASPRLRQILQDKYGNYVMQSALSESKAYGDLHIALVAAIGCHASALSNSPYGKKVLSCASFSKRVTFLPHLSLFGATF